MKLKTTHCYWCEVEIPLGAAVCPACGKPNQGDGKPDPYSPRMLLAIALAVAVLVGWNLLKGMH